MTERKRVFKTLVGSHNYNLNDQYSDKDWKIFVYPSFEDLYKGEKYSKQTITQDEDVSIHDIRQLGNLLYKSNINFMEVLFSKEIHFGQDHTLAMQLLELKNEIAKMNLPYLYNSCKGMYYSKIANLNKPTEKTKHLVDEFGYSTKEALHSYRVMDFIIRFEETSFNDFEKAMTYNDEEKEFMLEIKHGVYTEENFRRITRFLHDSRFVHLEEKYKTSKVNHELKEHIDELIMNSVKDNLF